MKNTMALVLLTAFFSTSAVSAAPTSSANKANSKSELTEREDILSYALGYNVGASMKSQPFKMKESLFFQGIKDASSGKAPQVSQEKAQEVLNAFKQELTKKYQAEIKMVAEKNLEKANAFLGENKKKTGVMELPSGLQYQVLTEGKGATPKATDTVIAHYRGQLEDGKEFDSSYARKEPITIPVNGTIPGWTEALQKMKVGSKWKLFIPPKLGYGDRGAGSIPPNALLLFEVELLDIKGAK